MNRPANPILSRAGGKRGCGQRESTLTVVKGWRNTKQRIQCVQLSHAVHFSEWSYPASGVSNKPLLQLKWCRRLYRHGTLL